MYNERVNQSILQPSTKTWITLSKDMLFKMGLGDVWEYQDFINPKHYLKEFSERIYDNYDKEWSAEVEMTTQHRLYKHIKTDFYFEQYLNMNNAAFRTSVIKIILSSHLFYIERGRWGRKIDIKERLCAFCDVIEDEFHCFVECPCFTDIRKGLLPPKLKKSPSMFNFIEYFRCDREESFDKMGLFCYSIIKKHKKYLLDSV